MSFGLDLTLIGCLTGVLRGNGWELFIVVRRFYCQNVQAGSVSGRAGREIGMTAGSSADGWIDLSAAIAALRADLEKAWLEGRSNNARLRFRVEPVDLTVQAGVTKSREGEGGVKWHILAIGAKASHETSATQTLHLRLSPVFFGADGKQLGKEDQLISDADTAPEGLYPAPDGRQGSGAPSSVTS